MTEPVYFKEGPSRLWRRLWTIPTLVLIWVLSLGTLPVVAAITLAVDFVRDPMKMPWTRVACGLAYFLTIHTLSLVVTTVVWLGQLLVPPWRGEAGIAANSWLQRNWGWLELRGLLKIFGMKISLEGRECLESGGPVIYLVRHVSTLDTMIPIVFGPPYTRVFRYVLKAELLYDPLLDIVGQRLRNHFARRGSENPEAEVEAVVRLARGMASHEGYVMYPEGTRFTPKRRERVLKSLRERDPERAAYAERLQATLPPTRRGPVALLTQVRDVDVVVVSHRGFEGASHIHSMLRGDLVGKTLCVRFQRYAPDEIPTGEDGVQDWLKERWLEVDAYASQAQTR